MKKQSQHKKLTKVPKKGTGKSEHSRKGNRVQRDRRAVGMRRRAGGRSGAERKHDYVAKFGKVERKKCANWQRRSRLEHKTSTWLRWYLADSYPLPFGTPHMEIIEKSEYALEQGTSTAAAAPRGTGKTTLLWGITLKAVMTGKAAFPVIIPWESKAVKGALRFWKNALCYNERLAADYPEFCAPFVHSKGGAQQLMALTWDDEKNENTGARLQISEGKIILPDSRGILGSTTINGNPRGMNYSTEDGRVIRPDIVMLDDPQSREVAESPSQVAGVIQIIDSDVMAMSGAGKKLTAFMACTVIAPNDVAEHYLNSAEWDATRTRRIVKWPNGWADAKSECAGLWREWEEIRADGLRNKDKERGAKKFYRQHKAKMIEGMEVSWTHRHTATQPDAYYGAMWDYYHLGAAAFASEHQNEPIIEGAGEEPYRLTAAMIASRVDPEREAFIVPAWCVGKIASTDINWSYAFTSAVVGFGRDQTAAVLWYGKGAVALRDDLPEAEFHRQLFEALVEHGKKIASLPCKPDVWHLDASNKVFPTVLRFCEQAPALCGLVAVGSTGVGAKNYKPYGKNLLGQPKEYCHMRSDVADGRRRKWFAWQADYWREVAQRAWLGNVGAPGSASLFRGHHAEFAEQIAREQLKGKALVGGQMFWNWHTQPGAHDYGDVMAQAFAAAAWGGVGTGGAPAAPAGPRRRPGGVTVIQM